MAKAKRPSGVCECGAHAYFVLTRGFVALADAGKHDELRAMGSWWADSGGYALAKCGGRTIRMHRVVMGATDMSMEVDHINGKPWDNRASNLRVCSHRRNQRNKTCTKNKHGFKGVLHEAKWGRYRAQIIVKGKNIKGPSRQTAVEAARDYDELALKHHGAFSKTNAALGLMTKAKRPASCLSHIDHVSRL